MKLTSLSIYNIYIYVCASLSVCEVVLRIWTRPADAPMSQAVDRRAKHEQPSQVTVLLPLTELARVVEYV